MKKLSAKLEPEIYAIAACAQNRVIGFNGSLPWDLPDERKYFAKITANSSVLMGSKTFASIPKEFIPLKGRQTIVVSKNSKQFGAIPDTVFIDQLEQFFVDIHTGKRLLKNNRLWIAGGMEIYNACLRYCTDLYLTEIALSVEGDSFFPEFKDEFSQISSELAIDSVTGVEYCCRHYVRSVVVNTRP